MLLLHMLGVPTMQFATPLVATVTSWNAAGARPGFCLTRRAYQEHCVYEYYSLQSRRLRPGHQPQGVGPDIWPVYQEGTREEGLFGRAGSRSGRNGAVRMDSFRGRSCSRNCGTAAFDGRRPCVQRRANGNNGPALPGCLASLTQLRRRPGSSGALAAGTQTRTDSSPGKEVSQIKKKEGTGIKRVNINVEMGLHNAFKAATAAQGVDMTTVLMEFIQQYVGKYESSTPKRQK